MKNKTMWIVVLAVLLLAALLIWRPWNAAQQTPETAPVQEQTAVTPAPETGKTDEKEPAAPEASPAPADETPAPTEQPAEEEPQQISGIDVDESEEGVIEEAEGEASIGF